MITIGFAAHNCLPYTIDTLKGIEFCSEFDKNTHFIFIDDGSKDNTYEALLDWEDKANLESSVSIIRHETAQGAPASWNEIIELAEGNNSDYVYILNNDIIVGYDWFNQMNKFFMANPECGVASSEVIDVQYPADKIKTNWSDWRNWTRSYGETNSNKVDIGCHFCCFGITKKCWNEIGTFDEGFLRTSYEDTDYTLRAERAGFKVLTTHSAIAFHYGGVTQHHITTTQGGNQFQQLNRKYFEQKWDVQLDGSICSRSIFWDKESDTNWKRRIPL